MKTLKVIKKIPVNIPLEHNGSISDTIQDFINIMQTITGGRVDLDCTLKGNITVYFENEKTDLDLNKNKLYDLDSLLCPDIHYRGDVKSLDMSESATKRLRKK